MAQLLLDTTFLIDAERDDAVLDDLIEDGDDVAIAAITVAEFQVGVELASGEVKERRAAYVSDILDVVPVLPYGLEEALVHAELLAVVRRAGRSRVAHDLVIAATARSTGRAVVTADLVGFDDLPGVEVRRH